MYTFKIVPLDKTFVDKLKRERTDAFGIEVTEEIAAGTGPCRLSLKPFKPGVDRRLLFLHSPFEQNNAFNQSGPVFVNAADVEPYADVHKFPKEIKADPVNFPLTLIGYNTAQRMVLTKLVGTNDVDVLISEIFESTLDVEYLHVRNAEAGCYICKVERV
ncbi:DUF1203 domain-containing protein [Fulvivirga ulvae]|uniref:DUF1203 domain-containing protein n=1 Tax=Fulvivirga ulvae TaxID=2904245 RepID=UPI001F2D51E2|nr:DUF1203 domain-containing protein [Fulvivirga ulvae]UII34657.1 DUF1203 domain-containing protein [Fulvivirga ulvae]